MSFAGRFPDCADCEGRGQYPCSVCVGGSADCERCEGSDMEPCASCERRELKQRQWREGKKPEVVR